MQLLVNDFTYDHPERDYQAFLEAVRTELSELGTLELREDEIPEAADIPVVLIAITTVAGGLFLAGKKVEENLDAWIRLGKRLLKAVRSLRKRFGPTRVDRDAATLLSFVAATAVEKSGSWELIHESDIPLRVFATRSENDLTNHPNAIYLRTWRSEVGRVLVVLVKSTGESNVLGPYDFFNFE